ncbi:MAG: tRNA lysidine(34) synthetase TilS, partial [Gammaproteobacteria bacterium]|nr:tRNA lysidine(34) synthetase TilS [Gammaproteobacteria bacterium]
GLGIPLQVYRIDAARGRGESLEAAARRARYAALAAMLDAGEVVLTAHHRRDQAETLMLQLLRGAGPAGLAAMPECAPLGPGRLVRPLLSVDPHDLRAYLRARGIEWSEDASNADVRFDRNYLRHVIFPTLAARWPGVERTLARAAAHQADSAEIAAALAEIDLAGARGPVPGTLAVEALERLSSARARNLLRAWLSECALPSAGARHLEDILEQALAARVDAEPLVNWPGAEVRRYARLLYASPPLPLHDASTAMAWNPDEPLELPLGRLDAQVCAGQGLRVERCRGARLEVRFRRGGERLRPAGSRHSTALKKLLQAREVPPWLRDRIPLIHVDGELAAVAGLCVAHDYAAHDSEAGWVVQWTGWPAPAD